MKNSAAWLLIVVSLGSIVSCDKIKQRQAREQAEKELISARREMTDKIKMSDDGITVDFDAVEKSRQKMEQAAGKMGGKLGEAMTLAASMQGDINRLGRECSEGAERFAAVFDWKSLAEKRDYEARRGILRDYITLNEKVLIAFEKYPKDLSAALDKIGFTGKERNDFDAGLLNTSRKTQKLVKIIRQCDIDCSNIGIALLDRLEKAGAAWSWDADEEYVQFTSEEDMEWFEGEMQKFSDLGDKQIAAQEKFAATLKAK